MSYIKKRKTGADDKASLSEWRKIRRATFKRKKNFFLFRLDTLPVPRHIACT